MKIIKYELYVTDYQDVLIPQDAKILKIGEQNNNICVWALVNPENIVENVEFKIVGTGHETDNLENYRYLDSLIMGIFVWHVFVSNIK